MPIFVRLSRDIMPRRKRCRHIEALPGITYFKPAGIPASTLETVDLDIDEYEAIRLADMDRLYQDEAAKKMGISRQTFGRIIDSAHHKIAKALTEGKALRIEKINEIIINKDSE